MRSGFAANDDANDDAATVAAAAAAANGTAAAAAAAANNGANDDGNATMVAASGALLKDRSGGAPKRSYMPYFSEVDVHARGADLFSAHLELLAENSIKLLTDLRRVANSGVVWSSLANNMSQLACRFIYAVRGATSANAVRYAKRLLQAGCDGDRDAYYALRDAFVSARSLARLAALRSRVE